MSDGARCHYCRKVPCVCPDEGTFGLQERIDALEAERDQLRQERDAAREAYHSMRKERDEYLDAKRQLNAYIDELKIALAKAGITEHELLAVMVERATDQLAAQREQHARAMGALQQIYDTNNNCAATLASDYDLCRKLARDVLAAPESATVLETARLRQAVVDAARCIKHWHDTGEDGMVVSKSHVFALWDALAALDRAEGR